MPFMGGADYLGPEFNGDTYRLKFIKDGRVIWVDVDAADRPDHAALAALTRLSSPAIDICARRPQFVSAQATDRRDAG